MQEWLLNQAAFRLRALGRLEEALEPMRAGAEGHAKREDWENAARSYSNLGELQLSLGRVKTAVADARQSVAYADCTDDAFLHIFSRSTLADVLHQHGDAAVELFAVAEDLQKDAQPGLPWLYSVQGFRYCDLLLDPVERAAWLTWGGLQPANSNTDVASVAAGRMPDLDVCAEVEQRADKTLNWAEANQLSLLDIALNHLTLARCAIYAKSLNGRPHGRNAQAYAGQAMADLRAAGQQHYIPLGLLTHAWFLSASGDEPGARADLDEAWRIASRGNMRLHMADIHLHRARLFRDTDELAKARKLIFECEYFRRLPELEDAERALL